MRLPVWNSSAQQSTRSRPPNGAAKAEREFAQGLNVPECTAGGSFRFLRASTYAAALEYKSSWSGPTRREIRRSQMHAINATLDGSWDLHGKSGRIRLTPDTVTLHEPGEEYGLAHDSPHSQVIVCLREGALDPDLATIFNRVVLNLPNAGDIVQRALQTKSDECFESRVFELFDWIAAASQRDVKRPKASRVRMQRLKRFVEDHAFEAVTLADMADVVGLSPFVCLRQFRAAVGTTPYAYLTQRRIREAQRLLKGGRDSLTEIAMSIGFKDTPYFCRAFKRATGVTPGKYREVALH